ncbi:MAG: transglycosylase domain-containing protein, partial [Hymenobacter sp.]|nr:transglycosylase domain-containing protein [Hymenobacter sp.]
MSVPKSPKTNPTAKPRRPWSNRAARAIWAVFVLGVGVFLLYPILVSMNLLFLFGKSPSLEELEDPKVEQPSEIYTADGVLIGKYFRENRVPVSLNKISPLLVKALVATEDVRFYEHSGIDATALARAVGGVLRGKPSGGGSTITQQLAKNLYNTRRGETRGGL